MVSPIDNVDLITGGALSVGFQSVEQIKPLGDLLRLIFKDEFFKNEKALDNISKSLKSIDKQNKKDAATTKEQLKKIHEASEKTVEKLHTISAENRKSFETFLSIGKTTANLLTKALAKNVKEVIDLSNTFRGIESSGAYVKEGFQTLFDTARSTGMSMEELAGHLRSSAPLIAKLNSSVGDGVKVFKQSLSSISKEYNLTRAEEVAAFSSAIENLTPSQLRQMSETELTNRVNETARQMKLLSLATGKTVEQIKEEQDAKAQTMRAQVWQRTNRSAYGVLKAFGLDSTEMIDYIASGGMNVTPEIAMQLAGDELLQNVLPEIMRLQQSGQLNTDSMARLQAKYGHLADRRMAQTALNVNNAGVYGAMSHSGLLEHYGANENFAKAFAGQNLNAVGDYLNPTSEGRRASNLLLQESEDLSKTVNNINTSLKEMLTGGVQGMTTTLDALNSIATPASKVAEVLGKIASNVPGGGIGGSLLSIGSTALGTWVGSSLSGLVGNGLEKGYTKARRGWKKLKSRKRGGKGGGSTPKAGSSKVSKLSKLGKVAGKKGLGKVAGKGLLRRIPGVGLLMGGIDAFQSARAGDWLGAVGNLSSGALSLLPGLGTAASLAIDAALMSREASAGESIESLNTPSTSQIGETATTKITKAENERKEIDTKIIAILENIDKNINGLYATSYQTRYDNIMTPMKPTQNNY